MVSIAIATAGFLSVSTTAFSQLKAEDQITFRQSSMMFMRWNIGKIKSQVVENPNSFNKDQVIAAANAVAAVANSGIGALFSLESKTGKGWKETRLKPEYFEQPEEVKKVATAFTREANQLALVAASGEMSVIKKQFETLFEACKNCHKKFRRKD